MTSSKAAKGRTFATSGPRLRGRWLSECGRLRGWIRFEPKPEDWEALVTIVVTEDNFVRAETNRMLVGLQAQAGGLNRWKHHREPASLDDQTVIRMNRDTLYSLAVVNISDGATLTVPDASGRYLTVMVVNQDHYINRVFTEPGEYPLTTEEFDTAYVLLAARVLVDPTDPDDVSQVHAIQDGFGLERQANESLELPDYDEESFTAVRNSVLAEASQGLHGTHGMFGKKDEVDPHTHLLGTAAGWGGLPEQEAYYESREPKLPGGPVHDHREGRARGRVLVRHRLRRRRVPPPQRPRRLQHQQRRRHQEPGRFDHRHLRRDQRGREPAAPAGGLELHRPHVPATPRDPRRNLDLPRPRTPYLTLGIHPLIGYVESNPVPE